MAPISTELLFNGDNQGINDPVGKKQIAEKLFTPGGRLTKQARETFEN